MSTLHDITQLKYLINVGPLRHVSFCKMALASYEAVWVKYPFFANIHLKDEQIMVLERLMSGMNCVVQLPTGFGKSLLFALPPVLRDAVSNQTLVADDIGGEGIMAWSFLVFLG